MRSATQLRNRKAEVLAVFAALLIISSSALILAEEGATGEEYKGGSSVVTYSDGNGQSVAVTYYGTATAEYNPEYWAGSIVGDAATEPDNWVGPETTVSGSVRLYWDGGYTGWPSPVTRSIQITLPAMVESWSLTTNNCSVNVSQGGSGSLSFTIDKKMSGAAGLQSESGSVSISFEVKVNQVFGGWTGSDGNR